MKIKKHLLKDIQIRKNFRYSESTIRSLKILMRINELNYLELLNNFSKIRSLNLKTKIKNRCFISSRVRGIMTKRVHLSRIKFKELTNNGFLLGYKKYSF